MKRLAVAVFGLMAASVAVGGDWRKIDEHTDRIFYVEREGIKKSEYNGKPIVGTWIKLEIKTNEKEKTRQGKYVRSESIFLWYNCADKTVSESGQFVQHDINGNVLGNIALQDFHKQFNDILPNSTEEKAYDVVCINSFMRDYAALGEKPTPYEVKKLADEYPQQMQDFIKYLKGELR